MIIVAFVNRGSGFVPVHVQEIKAGDIYYLVIDGQRAEVCRASADAYFDADKTQEWVVEGQSL